MINENRNMFTIRIQRFISLVACAGILALTGCSTVAPNYQPTNDNVRTLLTLPAGQVSLGEFTAKSGDLNRLSVRAGSYKSPYNDSFAEYLKAALRAELESSGRFNANASIGISGELLTNSLDSSSGTGTAHISARIVVKKGGDTLFDKVVRGDDEWDSSFMGAIAIPLARQNYGETVKRLLGNLYADRDFQSATTGSANFIPSTANQPEQRSSSPVVVSVVETNVDTNRNQPAESQNSRPNLTFVQPVSQVAPQTVAITPQLPEPRQKIVNTDPVEIADVKFAIGESSNTVEKMAKQQGCESKLGAGLINHGGPVEQYRESCLDGRIFTARCEFRQCAFISNGQ